MPYMRALVNDITITWSCELRCFRLVSSYEVSGDALMNVTNKAVMLAEIVICHCSLLEDTLVSVGNSCPQLKSLRLNRGHRRPHGECDDEALAIAWNMPELRQLQLFGNRLTNEGLESILDGCMHLGSLDLRQCFYVNLEEDILMSCRDRLIKLRLPNDSTDDYEFYDAIEVGSSQFSDFNYDNDCILSSQIPVPASSKNGLNCLMMFYPMGAIDILLGAQSVCFVWRKVSKEPHLFHSIDMWNWSDLFDENVYDMEKMAREAVDRSCGRLVELTMVGSGSDELLAYIADK
ncbi:putative F-box/LRR-repeat protein 23 [Papaver somniferum]|uniref:putative F-box/LRR-repeat protein 23 n=1 Tax=Papaver somniferum TaxID=3469 RepID=UPI000E702308|nr:putative F-box/LRR-repeat protein 23 [Papaver somniferum]